MAYSRHIDAQGFLITRLYGRVTLEDLLLIDEELPDYAPDGVVYEIVLHSDDLQFSFDRKAVDLSTRRVRGVLADLRQGAIAFVARKDAIYGLCLQIKARTENEAVPMKVVRTEAEARQWLTEMRGH